MDEAQKHCDRIAIIKKGKLISCDEPKQLIDSLGNQEATLEDVYLQYAVGN